MICCLDLLLQLFAQKYGQPGCQLPTTVDRTVCGTSVFIKWKCAVVHNGHFFDRHQVNWVLANDLEACATVILSRNKFAQFERLNLGLTVVSRSAFSHAQRVYHIPANGW